MMSGKIGPQHLRRKAMLYVRQGGTALQAIAQTLRYARQVLRRQGLDDRSGGT